MSRLMGKNWRVFLVAMISMPGLPVWGHANIKNVKVAVSNPGDAPWIAADVVVPISDIKKIAPDFTPGAMVITATSAATMKEDSAILETEELPSQIDDLDGDGKGDELAFQIDLRPRQTRIVTISYGEEGRIWRLRNDDQQKTNAMFSGKFEGLGWESERIAFRIYFDARNAIDIYGKRRLSLQLPLYATPDYVYHQESPNGRDIFAVGDAVGIGGVAAIVNGKLVKVADVKDRKWRIISAGAVRSIVELEYGGWSVGGNSITLHSRITQWAGERGFWHMITATPSEGLSYVTGFTKRQEIPAITSAEAQGSAACWLASWGEQAVAPGAKAQTDMVPGQNLGLAVVTTMPRTSFLDDVHNRLVKFDLQKGTASWYAMAAWDQEGSHRREKIGPEGEMDPRHSITLPAAGLRTKEEFLSSVETQAAHMEKPVQIQFLSTAAAPQPAPEDASAPRSARTTGAAVSLLQESIDRTAAQWEPVLRSSPADSFSANSGLGFFTEGDDQTGEWRRQNGHFWTGSFWIGELWQMYGRTHDEKYRNWAQLWESRVIGHESDQNHDAGFLYYYSSALGFDLTQDESLKSSAIRGAERLEQLFNPRTHLIASWGVNGDDTIVDTMMNLQLLWWVSDKTGEAKWREIGKQHALRTAEWYVRPDGSVIQSVHYNPGDNRQSFHLHGGLATDMDVRIPNETAPGDWIFNHTHQGYSTDTAWARGQAWAIYGFTSAYGATHEQSLLESAEQVADFAIDNLADDFVPWYDFLDEGVHFRNRDSSAAAIMAGGLLHLSTLTNDKRKAERYRQTGEKMVQALIDHYLTPVGENDKTPPGILRHGSSTRPSDVMLIYGQYYLLEDLLWIEQHKQ
jgi:unsaturated chondroitin disaccharide hydrolase